MASISSASNRIEIWRREVAAYASDPLSISLSPTSSTASTSPTSTPSPPSSRRQSFITRLRLLKRSSSSNVHLPKTWEDEVQRTEMYSARVEAAERARDDAPLPVERKGMAVDAVLGAENDEASENENANEGLRVRGRLIESKERLERAQRLLQQNAILAKAGEG